jgi:hypothetical protein
MPPAAKEPFEKGSLESPKLFVAASRKVHAHKEYLKNTGKKARNTAHALPAQRHHDRGWDNLRGGRGIFRDTPGMYKMRPEGLGRRFGNFFKIWAALRS